MDIVKGLIVYAATWVGKGWAGGRSKLGVFKALSSCKRGIGKADKLTTQQGDQSRVSVQRYRREGEHQQGGEEGF